MGQRGLWWIGGGVLAVVLSQLLLAVGSLLGILMLPVGTLSALYGLFLLVSPRRSERWSDPVDWSIVAAMLLGAGSLAWIVQDWTVLPISAVPALLVAVARRRRARLAREWQEHVASRRPTDGQAGLHDS